ncbi:PepSY domain-containing protein [Streptomyces sp. NPDC060000]|uniref:PepSY domain-containing protein n=1 Tax=Streptomyces sp. NPDC060000 TaxID=3347031 RepID=UPI003682DF96
MGDIDGEPLGHETSLQSGGQPLFVLDYQYAHGIQPRTPDGRWLKTPSATFSLASATAFQADRSRRHRAGRGDQEPSMSQPEPQQQQQPESTPDSPVALSKSAKSAKSAKTFRARLPRVSRRRGTVLGVAVVLAVAAATGAAAVVDHDHGEKGDHGRLAAEHGRADGDDGRQGAHEQARGGRGGQNDESGLGDNSQGTQSSQSGQSGQSGQNTEGTLAPAPLPAVSAGAAIEAANKAVAHGRTEALHVIAEQGGGSAWEVEVLGTDGVLHLVTIDGATGTVTGNTVASATSDTAS